MAQPIADLTTNKRTESLQLVSLASELCTSSTYAPPSSPGVSATGRATRDQTLASENLFFSNCFFLSCFRYYHGQCCQRWGLHCHVIVERRSNGVDRLESESVIVYLHGKEQDDNLKGDRANKPAELPFAISLYYYITGLQ